jgi:hypothetical protein
MIIKLNKIIKESILRNQPEYIIFNKKKILKRAKELVAEFKEVSKKEFGI